MNLERHMVELVGLFLHNVPPVLHMVFPLLLSQLLERVEFFSEGVRPARLFNLKLGLRHLTGLL